MILTFLFYNQKHLSACRVIFTSFKWGVSKELLKAASVLSWGYLRSLSAYLLLCCGSLCEHQLAEQDLVCNSAAHSHISTNNVQHTIGGGSRIFIFRIQSGIKSSWRVTLWQRICYLGPPVECIHSPVNSHRHLYCC